MSLPLHLLLGPILHGPTCPTPVRHLLADHLNYLRKVGAPPPAPPEEEEGSEPWLPPGEGVPLEELAPAERLQLLGEAAVELHQGWTGQVLESAPRTFALGLCFVADRGAYLLEGIDPDLTAAFARLRDRLMGHTQGGERLSDEALGAAVDELESLVPAVAQRARALFEQLREREPGSR